MVKQHLFLPRGTGRLDGKWHLNKASQEGEGECKCRLSIILRKPYISFGCPHPQLANISPRGSTILTDEDYTDLV